jgi:hypothetical protein
MHVNQVEVNAEVAPGMFSMPAPEGMADLLNMVGNWKVQVAQRGQPGGPLTESELEIELTSGMDGKLIESHYSTQDEQEIQWSLSFDTFRKVYRLTEFSSGSGYMDILHGVFDEDSAKLTLSNIETDTSFKVADLTVHSRFSVLEITPDSFKIEREASIDGGENWWVAVTEVYARQP